MGGIRVLSLTGGTIKNHSVEEVATLLKRDDALVWVDVPECSDEAVSLLTEVLRCHRLAVRDCMQRNRVPRVRIYPHQQLLILHGPEHGPSGHVHYLELDQVIGEKYVTVHGPINPTVPLDIALRETDGVRKRIEAGRLLPGGAVPGPARPLLAVRTMGAPDAEVLGRVATLEARIPVDDRPLVADATDQMNRIRNLADGEREYLQGVIEFYRARAETKMTVAAERLAVIAVVTLPITALSSIYGMNIIVNGTTHVTQLIVVLAIMAVMPALLLAWAKRRGWWWPALPALAHMAERI
jgi:Mg2+ and Co2+ transporter CorA